MDRQAIGRQPETTSMPYTNCKTRIISLLDLDLPASATEETYRQIYDKISRSTSPQANLLVAAVDSVKIGIAPPVAFPTETVYGLGADATNRASTAGIFAAKGRPSDNPLIVHVASREHLERLTGEPLPSVYHDLVQECWPGPLTILVPVPRDSPFAENVHPGQKTIGFRVPQSKYARFFIAATGRPIAAPSANSSGKPSPTRAQHVKDDLDSKINFILDGGSCDVGVESTVVDGLHDPPLILRPGGVSLDDFRAHGKKYNNKFSQTEIGYKHSHGSHDASATSSSEPQEAPRAPGMKYKHYAPTGKLILFERSAPEAKVEAELEKLLESTPSASQVSVAVLTSTEWSPFASLNIDVASTGSQVGFGESSDNTPSTQSSLSGSRASSEPSLATEPITVRHSQYKGCRILSLDLGTLPKQVAQSLFAALRACDDEGCHFILAEAPRKPEWVDTNGEIAVNRDHHYDAVIERMRKAASEVVS